MLVIDGINYDEHINTQTYSVMQADEYGGTEYVDGWWVKHRSVARTRITGKVELSFNNATDYNAFVANMQSLNARGCHDVEIYVNNLNDIAYTDAYIAWETKTAISTAEFGRAPVFWYATLTIEER